MQGYTKVESLQHRLQTTALYVQMLYSLLYAISPEQTEEVESALTGAKSGFNMKII